MFPCLIMTYECLCGVNGFKNNMGLQRLNFSIKNGSLGQAKKLINYKTSMHSSNGADIKTKYVYITNVLVLAKVSLLFKIFSE